MFQMINRIYYNTFSAFMSLTNFIMYFLIILDTEALILSLLFCFLAVLKTSSSNQSANNGAKAHVQELPEGELLLQVICASAVTNIILWHFTAKKGEWRLTRALHFLYAFKCQRCLLINLPAR